MCAAESSISDRLRALEVGRSRLPDVLFTVVGGDTPGAISRSRSSVVKAATLFFRRWTVPVKVARPAWIMLSAGSPECIALCLLPALRLLTLPLVIGLANPPTESLPLFGLDGRDRKSTSPLVRASLNRSWSTGMCRLPRILDTDDCRLRSSLSSFWMPEDWALIEGGLVSKEGRGLTLYIATGLPRLKRFD